MMSSVGGGNWNSPSSFDTALRASSGGGLCSSPIDGGKRGTSS